MKLTFLCGGSCGTDGEFASRKARTATNRLYLCGKVLNCSSDRRIPFLVGQVNWLRWDIDVIRQTGAKDKELNSGCLSLSGHQILWDRAA